MTSGAVFTGLKPAAARDAAGGDFATERAYVQSVLGLQAWAHKLYQAMHAAAPSALGEPSAAAVG